MAQIHNTDLFKELKEGGKIQQMSDRIPSELAEKVVPVMEVNPKMLRRCNVVAQFAKIVTGAGTILATPTNKQFWLLGGTLSMTKDATCDGITSGTYAYISCQINGVAGVAVASIAGLVTTAQSTTISFSLPEPVLIDAGTNISITGVTYTAGLMARNATIWGYYVDNPLA